MNAFRLDVILTSFTLFCFLVLGFYSIRQFYTSAPNIASYALSMSHMLVGVSIILRLVPMLFSVPIFIGWSGRIVRTLAYLYLLYAFVLIALPCSVPLFRSLSCPFCALDLIEPDKCKQSVLRVLFTASAACIILWNVFALGAHPYADITAVAPSDGYFWYSIETRLPLWPSITNAGIQIAVSLITAVLVIHTFPQLRAMNILAASLILNVICYLLYLLVWFLELRHGQVHLHLRAVYTVSKITQIITYIIPTAWVTLFDHRNLFSLQKKLHLYMIGERLSVYNDTLHTSVKEAIGLPRD